MASETPTPPEKPTPQPKTTSGKSSTLVTFWLPIITAGITTLGGIGLAIANQIEVDVTLTSILSIFGNQELKSNYKAAQRIQQDTLETILAADTTGGADWRKIEGDLNNAIFLLELIPQDADFFAQAQQVRQQCETQKQYVHALVLATDAYRILAEDQNNSLPVETWEKLENLFQEAIAHLNSIDPGSPLYRLADTKIAPLQASINYAQSAKLAAPWIQGVRTAEEAGKLVAIAKTFEDWTTAISLWQKAIQLLDTVPPDHAVKVGIQEQLQTSLADYRAKLAYAQKQQLSIQSI